MQGIFIAGRRPKSKAEVKRTLADPNGAAVFIEATSLHGNEYDGPVSAAPDGTYYFVGPDPYTSRRFYGILTIRDGVASVK